MNKFSIHAALVKQLIQEQFPFWSHLSVNPIPVSGWDNRMFRLGSELVVRFPSAACYAEQVFKEQRWLPILAKHLPFLIPQPVAIGKPSLGYPWHWSIYTWIEGDNADSLGQQDRYRFARDLAAFLHELRALDSKAGPVPGEHNFYRGAHPSIYDHEAQAAIEQLSSVIDVNAVRHVWAKALSSSWLHEPVWVHGDVSPGNILVRDGRLIAVIDFGCLGVGDPACDLVMAWNFFDKETRKIFRAQAGLDHNTWYRARGWCLWKTLITLASLSDYRCLEGQKMLTIVQELINDEDICS